jgi:myo-inositol-1-phosphate synthase
MGSVRVAIVGVGNCATSLIQGVEYYKDADPEGTVPGLMHVTFGEYHVKDVEFVAAFDVDAKKVGFDLSEATQASERSLPTFMSSTSNAATNSTSLTWYSPNRTCMSPGTVVAGSASL